MFKSISVNKQTKAIKTAIGEKAFNVINSKWQKLQAKGLNKQTFPEFYKAQRNKQIDQMIDSWMKVA